MIHLSANVHGSEDVVILSLICLVKGERRPILSSRDDALFTGFVAFLLLFACAIFQSIIFHTLNIILITHCFESLDNVL